MKTNTLPTINIFFTVDNDYAKYLAVSMVSIIANTGHPVYFYILDGGISKESKRRIEDLKKIKPFQIEYILIDNKRFNNAPKSSQKRISDNTNYRFLISTLRPNMDKCIFLDADLVAIGDIAQLWNVDITDDYMAAVTDQFSLSPNSWATKLPLPQNYTYVNTGVTVMNLKKWREDRIEEKLFDNMAKYRRLLWFPDQDTLNITLAPHVRYLPHVFNAMPVQRYYAIEQEKEAFSDPVILHWAGLRKPWKNPSYPLAHLFFKYARMTPFYEDILYSDISTNTLDETHKLLSESSPISGKTSYPKEIAQLKTVLSELATLHKYRVKLRQIRIKICFSWGKRKQEYKEQKRYYKTKIQNIMQRIEHL